MKNKRTIGFIAIALIIILVGAGVTRARAQQQTTSDTTNAEMVMVTTGNLAASISASGKVLPQRQANLALETPGRVTHIPVTLGQTVQTGQTLIQLDTTTLERNLTNAQQTLLIQQANLTELQADPAAQTLASAQAQLASAQAQLDTLLADPDTSDLTQAQAALSSAQANLQIAAARYHNDNPTLNEANDTLSEAKDELDTALDNWDNVDNDPNSDEAATLTTAQDTYQTALDDYNTAAKNITPTANDTAYYAALTQVIQAETALANLTGTPNAPTLAGAEASLAQAQANLDNLLAGASDERITQATAQVEQAQLAVANAQASLDNATLTAPFPGVITAIHVAEGELASGLAVQLVDMDSLEVVLDVDEIDIGEVTLGQPAEITLEAWPNETMLGEVTTIAPQATGNQSGAIVSYQVRLSFTNSDLPVRAGMTANANLITATRENVRLVPNQAIIANRSAGTYKVNLVGTDAEGNQTVEEVEVTIGLRDGAFTEILEGVNEGDELMIGDFTSPTFQFGNGPGGDDGGSFGGGN